MSEAETLEKAKERSEEQIVRHKAIDLLSRREHTCVELSTKLLSRGYDSHIVDDVLVMLKEKNYLSDERFAEQFTGQLVRKGYGESGIRAKLGQRGVSSQLAKSVVQEQQVDWFERAKTTLHAKHAAIDSTSMDRQEKEKYRMKRARFLKSRGFSTEQILNAIDTVDGDE